jgi:uncharacterized protein (TIGR01777 family)
MNVTVSGASGFIGRRLTEKLLAAGHSVHVLSRNPRIAVPRGVVVSEWDPVTGAPPRAALETADAVVHLAGEPVAQRWTDLAKARIRGSRVIGTGRLVDALAAHGRRPAALVCASAIGIYGDRGDEVLTEASAAGSGFLAEVCLEWEKQARRAEALGMRVWNVRIGIVLARHGGALAKMLPPFRAFVGGRMGSGLQWMSWIHLDDLVSLITWAIDHPQGGVLNGTAPNPATNVDFTAALAGALHRPAVFPIPPFALRAIFGEMSQVLLASQRVHPEAALSAGFRFRHPELGPAIEDVLRA